MVDLRPQIAVHTFFIYGCGFQGHVNVGFICLRQASGPDLKSPGGADASADGALPLFDEVLSINPRVTAPTEPITSASLGQAARESRSYAFLRKIDL
jgi:hypothetical protein